MRKPMKGAWKNFRLLHFSDYIEKLWRYGLKKKVNTLPFLNILPRKRHDIFNTFILYLLILFIFIFIKVILTYILPSFLQSIVLPGFLEIIRLSMLITLAVVFVKHLRKIRTYEKLAVQELQDARRVQMSLMPETAPSIEELEIAGKCVPANTVGGDFFDYLSLANGKIGIALADVSGKGLKGAMYAVLTNGMLHEITKMQASCGKILSRLNASLYPRMEKMMFTALGVAIFNQDAKMLQWANAGQPYPIVKRGEQAFEFESDGELPLGVMPNLAYTEHEFPLQAGDIVVFYTDGLVEAENQSEEMYDSERLKQVVTRINSVMNAEEILEAILGDVTDFIDSAERYDDMTVVVVKKL